MSQEISDRASRPLKEEARRLRTGAPQEVVGLDGRIDVLDKMFRSSSCARQSRTPNDALSVATVSGRTSLFLPDVPTAATV